VSDWYIKDKQIYYRYDPVPLEVIVDHCNELEARLRGRETLKNGKLVRDGKVAVAISPGYGAGWSTWSNIDPTDGRLNQLFVENKHAEAMSLANELYPGAYVGGGDQVQIIWVALGKRFRIEEYDGYESIQFAEDTDWSIA
jgi:hypothetical protein